MTPNQTRFPAILTRPRFHTAWFAGTTRQRFLRSRTTMSTRAIS